MIDYADLRQPCGSGMQSRRCIFVRIDKSIKICAVEYKIISKK